MSEYCNCEKCQTNDNRIPVNTRNSAVLADFIAYCWAHPTQRFWQALRNWSRFNFIYGSEDQVAVNENVSPGIPIDTFNFKGRDE